MILHDSDPFLIHVNNVMFYTYCKCSKISNTFLSPFLNKISVIRAGIHKMYVRMAIRQDPDQTASSEAV